MPHDRTEKPTPKRRREAREKGQVARSRDLSSALVFLSAVLALGFGGAFFVGQIQVVLRQTWSRHLLDEIDNLAAANLAAEALFSVMKLAAPIILLTLTTAFLASVLQSGVVISSHGLQPKLSGLSPKNNLKKVFSPQGLVQLAKSSFLILILSWMAFESVRGSTTLFASLAMMDFKMAFSWFGGFLFSLLLKAALLLAVLGAADLIFQKYKFEKDLRQTKQEVKDDLKHTEGNPLIKGRIRRLQREMARKRMMAAVPEADVVVVNPTHFSVALKYDLERMSAPQVTAKGQGPVAARIREIAEENRVPVVENKPLARSLYKSAEVGSEIPADLFKAVAQLLAYVYKLREENWH